MISAPSTTPAKMYETNFSVSGEMVHYGESSISTFEQFFASIDKIFVLGGRLGTRLELYEDLGSS